MKPLPLLALVLLALAGCAEDSAPVEPTPEPTPAEDGNQTVTAPKPTTLSCTSDIGAVVISLSGPAGNIGGCALGEISGSMQVTESMPGAGCTIGYDADGDSQSDGDVVVGTTYDSGTSFTAFCQPPGIDEANSITLIKA